MVEDIKNVLECSPETADFVFNIYLQAKKLDKDVALIMRKNLVGVGKPDEYLRFYFANKKGSVSVKFKHRPRAVKLSSLTPEQLYGEIRDVFSLFATGNFKLGSGSGHTIYRVNQSRYSFINALAAGLNPFDGQKIVDFPQNVQVALKNIGLFILRYEKIDSTSFKVFSSDEDIRKKAETILEQKRKKQVVVERVGSLWTNEEDEQLKKEYMENISLQDIAALHGRTLTAVQRRILKIIPIEDIKK